MERLTIRNSDGSVSQPTTTTFEKAMHRLAAYEDTGMTPETVAQLKRIAEIFHCDPADPAQLKGLLNRLERMKGKGVLE